MTSQFHTDAVKTLLRKYKRANKGIEDTRVPFEELTGSLDVIKVSAWEKDEEKAKEERGEHLNIYQLKIDKGEHFKASIQFHVPYILIG